MPAPRDNDPRYFAWWLAAISLALPFIGAILMLAGASEMMRGGAHGWLLYAGVACFVVDLVIDLWWAHPGISRSDEPNLNARGSQLAGRQAIVVEAIENGRGKVRVGDTVWPAEGEDLPAGAACRVVGVRGTALVVVVVKS